MAGIDVPQYDIFKIGTKRLKHHKWNLNITKKEAFQSNEIVALFESQEFRLIADILQEDISQIDFTKYIITIVIDTPGDFRKVMRPDGITVNGCTFKRFVGTTSGLKNNSVVFVNTFVLDELKKRSECGRKMDIEIVPAKLEAYKSLTCSASQPICDPNGIIVVGDCITHVKEDIIKIDDSGDDPEPKLELLKDQDLENDASDGFALCTIGYMERISESLGLDYVTNGVCLRNAWLKGMVYAFPINEFVEQYNDGNYIIKDIWGRERDLRDAELILTESVFKLWYAYDSIEDYTKAYHENGYTFSVTKISPQELDDQREVNYQYLQSYHFTDEDIEELCTPTVNYLKDSLCGDYSSTLKFLGIVGNVGGDTWQQALRTSPKMMQDPFIVESVYRMIQKKIDGAKIGKLIVEGNYQIASGDPFSLMQSMCGLKVTGLLGAGQIYSSYWSERQVNEVVVFRSPMTSHNNIRKCEVVDTQEMKYWYQYMDNIMILNSFDSMCQALNGCDYDSDILFSTNNAVLLRRHRKLPPIICIQRNAEKKVVTEDDLIKTNRDGLGNQVGTITNRITAMMEVQSHFEPDSREYKELDYRIACGQLFQQNTLDALKGIIAKPMPLYWYNYKACDGDKFLQSICVEKKPYFMTYIYDDYKHRLNNYIKEAEATVLLQFKTKLEVLLNKIKPNKKEKKFLEYYHAKYPFGIAGCAMNRICNYIESQFFGYVPKLKADNNFDYSFLKMGIVYDEDKYTKIKELHDEFITLNIRIKGYQYAITSDREEILDSKEQLARYVKHEIREICPDEDEMTDILLDLHYLHHGNSQFFWICTGKNIINRLEKMVYGDF